MNSRLFTALLVVCVTPAAALAQAGDVPEQAAPDVAPELKVTGMEAGEPADLPSCLGSCFTIQEENDAFGGEDPTDSFYTQGLRLQARWRRGQKEWQLAQQGVLARWFPNSAESWGVELGHNIYTPSSIHETELSEMIKDRPYAGWLYGGLLWDVSYKPVLPFSFGEDTEFDGFAHLSTELTFGTTGPDAVGGPIQSNWHGLLRAVSGLETPRQPQGWGIYETRDRVSVDLALKYSRDVLGASVLLGKLTGATGSALSARLSGRLRADAGWMFDGAGVGAELRTGFMRRSLEEHPRHPVELYAYVRTDARLVLYNGLIQAPLLHGVQSGVSHKWTVGELSYGVVVRAYVLNFVWGQMIRTNELNTPPLQGPANHRVGQIQLSLVF